ncbi:GmrSD restriction endonuclease domain-containing protein [Serinicoccus kebangsaanensis]|uniref:GmrSD restriction endonuclease domain-containing protein n=1 Tax=Serinicoccus kebangsaanensis TaxID=2602069 RepID=UPI00124F720E|nr:DUF262 domain-containing protein [Serinicoccus kebangsaanensis]
MSLDLEDLDMDVPADNEEEDPKTQMWESIADGLATLSESPDVPDGISVNAAMFTREDVDFSTDAWIHRLSDVQGWLSLSGDLPTNSYDDFVKALASELGIEMDEALEVGDGAAQLSVKTVEKLRNRVETAVGLQQRFLEDLDTDGVSRAEATTLWSEIWSGEEDSVAESDSLQPVSAKAAVWHIFQLTKKKLNLAPSYQRGDVWRTGDRQALIESILRGIPLPSLILLRTEGATTHEVVDGKQRLTAILRFVGAHPRALERVRAADARHKGQGLLSLFTTDYPAFRRAWKVLEKETLTTKLEDEYYYPFKLRNNDDGGLRGEYLESFQGKYYTEISEKKIRVSGQEIDVDELFTGAPDYQIPVIEYLEATQRQIHEVFKLYNKQGVHLNAEEIRNAVYHEVTLMPATLFAAGDAAPGTRADQIANGALVDVPGLEDLGKTLKDYGFGDSRYKRTKVLSWILAVLLRDTNGKPLMSTAKHIDQLLDEVSDAEEHPDHSLRDNSTLARLFTWIAGVAETHMSHDELWAPEFKDGGSGGKWQELQLVGSLVGIAFAMAASPEDIEDRIDANADAIFNASKNQWKRMEKTQTRTQWDYIARIATELVELLGIDPNVASAAVRDKFGSSGFESLRAMIIVPKTDD